MTSQERSPSFPLVTKAFNPTGMSDFALDREARCATPFTTLGKCTAQRFSDLWPPPLSNNSMRKRSACQQSFNNGDSNVSRRDLRHRAVQEVQKNDLPRSHKPRCWPEIQRLHGKYGESFSRSLLWLVQRGVQMQARVSVTGRI